MTIYGYCNAAFFNLCAEGDEVWFSTREARNRALEALREDAVACGLARSAAYAGIYRIKSDSAGVVGVILQDLAVRVEQGGVW